MVSFGNIEFKQDESLDDKIFDIGAGISYILKNNVSNYFLYTVEEKEFVLLTLAIALADKTKITDKLNDTDYVILNKLIFTIIKNISENNIIDSKYFKNKYMSLINFKVSMFDDIFFYKLYSSTHLYGLSEKESNKITNDYKTFIKYYKAFKNELENIS